MSKILNIKYCKNCMIYIELEPKKLIKKVEYSEPYKAWNYELGDYNYVFDTEIKHKWACPSCETKYEDKNEFSSILYKYEDDAAKALKRIKNRKFV